MSPEAPPLAVVELDSIVGILIAKFFPGYTRLRAEGGVRNPSTARCSGPYPDGPDFVTLNRARFQLEDASALCSADRL